MLASSNILEEAPLQLTQPSPQGDLLGRSWYPDLREVWSGPKVSLLTVYSVLS